MKGVEFAPVGFGYVLRIPSFGTELAVRRLFNRTGETHGELTVTSALPGINSWDGHLFQGRVNLSSGRMRTDTARHLAARTPGVGMDWTGLLEELCVRVLSAHRKGEPVQLVGALPTRLAVPMRLEPILPAGVTSIFYGEGDTGKSTLAVAIAVSVETGMTVIPGWTPRVANVLYLDWETGPEDLDVKVKAIASGAGISDQVQIRYRFCAGPLADQAEDIAELVAEEKVGLVVIDSAGLASGTMADGADAAESAFRMFGVFRQMRTTVLLIDHVSKADANEPSRPARPYGSIYKTNLARATFELRRADNESERSSLGLYPTKFNLGRKPKPIGLSVEQTEGAIRYGREELMGTLVKHLTQADRIASVLRAGAMHYGLIAEEVDLDERTVRAVLSKQANARRFQPLGDGRWGLRHAG